MTAEKKQRPANSTYKKLAVQWLNEALCFVSSFVVVDSSVLRNRQLLVAANRSGAYVKDMHELLTQFQGPDSMNSIRPPLYTLKKLSEYLVRNTMIRNIVVRNMWCPLPISSYY